MADVIILTAIGAYIVFLVSHMIRKRKKAKSSCSSCCGMCSGCTGCTGAYFDKLIREASLKAKENER